MVYRILPYLLFFSFGVSGQATYVDYFNDGIAARDTGNYAAYLENIYKADSLRPLHPVILFRLGGAYVLNGQPGMGVTELKQSLMINAELPLDTDEDLNDLRQTEYFKELVAYRDSLLLPVVHSKVAMRLDERDLHAEGLARDPASGNWYIGSVRKRKIIRMDDQGNISEFRSSGQDSLMAVMGLAVTGQKLWVTSVPADEMISSGVRGPAMVIGYDLATGEVAYKFNPGDGREHWFGDIAADPSGNLFISDSFTNEIYMIDSSGLALWLDTSEKIGNLQGIDADDKFVYVSDYLSGIFRISRQTRRIEPLNNPFPELLLKGTDGVRLYKNSLILTINGQVPNKLVRLNFNPASFELVSYEVLDSNHPDFGEPTLGIIADDTFYYVGNSSWAAYKEGELIEEGLPPVKILFVTLE